MARNVKIAKMDGYVEMLEQYMMGDACAYPPEIETVVIPSFARETSHGWVWYTDDDPGNPEVGPQPMLRRITLPRAFVRSTRTKNGETTHVLVPNHVAHERGIETVEEREHADTHLDEWGMYR